MSRTNDVIVSRHDSAHGSVRSYTFGFVISLLLSLAAYWIIDYRIGSHAFRMISIVGLALAQLTVQLTCFLHLGRESKPRWNLTILLFAAIVVIILVFGSLWIMYNLNYHMTNLQLQHYLHNQDGI